MSLHARPSQQRQEVAKHEGQGACRVGTRKVVTVRRFLVLLSLQLSGSSHGVHVSYGQGSLHDA